MRGGGLVVEMLLLLPRGAKFESMLGHMIVLIFFPLILRVAAAWMWLAVNGNGLGTAGRGRGAARAQPLRGVGGCGRLGLWRGRCVAWEVAAGRGRGVGGWRAAAAGQGWGSADRGRSWPVTKPSTKVMNAKKKHKFVYKA
jgi:hypothetical protein